MSIKVIEMEFKPYTFKKKKKQQHTKKQPG